MYRGILELLAVRSRCADGEVPFGILSARIDLQHVSNPCAHNATCMSMYTFTVVFALKPTIIAYLQSLNAGSTYILCFLESATRSV